MSANTDGVIAGPVVDVGSSDRVEVDVSGEVGK